MAQYQNRPVKVEAVQWLDDDQSFKAMQEILHKRYWTRTFSGDGTSALTVSAAQGDLRVVLEDWLIEQAGQFSVLKPEAFAAAYEPAG